MTEQDYQSFKREILRLERSNPIPHHACPSAVKLYTLKAATMAYEQGLFPVDADGPVDTTTVH